MSADKRYHVEINYTTFAHDADEAIFSTLSVVADRSGGFVTVTEDDGNVSVFEGELQSLGLVSSHIGSPVEAGLGEDARFNVVLSNTTYADNPKEAVEISLSAIDARNGAYIEVFAQDEDEALLEGDLPAVFPSKSDDSKVVVIFNPLDNYITQGSSSRVKRAFTEYFDEVGGVPAEADHIDDEMIRELASAHSEEFGEACESYERDSHLKP